MKTVNKTGFKTKSIDLSFKMEENEEGRVLVKGYFSSWGVIDSDADVILPGAFLKSINDRGVNSQANRKIAHLAFHDQRRPVGTLVVLKEDETGLYFESLLGTDSEGEDAAKRYMEGIIREHSIGFRYIADKMRFVEVDEDKIEALGTQFKAVDYDAVREYGGYWEISEVKLYEGSYVTFGSNSETPNLTGKSEKELAEFEKELDESATKLSRRISDGEKGIDIEREILYLCSQYKALGETEPLNKHSLIEAAKEQDAKPDRVKSYFEILAMLQDKTK